jgi:putative aldouronate transport system permease protein
MLFSGGMIPVYMVVRGLNITDTIWAMVIPNAIATYNMLVMKNYFQSSIPEELHEAAAIDGCGPFQSLLKVVLPLSRPILAVITLFYAVGHWNAFFNAIIYLRDQKLYPLQIVLREIMLQNSLEAVGGDMTGMYEKVMRGETMKYAVIIVASVPVLLFYPLVQKYFTKGIMVGAIKG